MKYAEIEKAAEQAVLANDAFLVELEVKPNNVIIVYVDADEGLSMDQIKMINRNIESELDRDVEDFNLTVSSPDLNRPLKIWRQYRKNVGRFLKVTFNDRKVEGKLEKVEQDFLVLGVPQKKKSAPHVELEIQFADIAEAKVAIRFN
ncbi:MAG TPA: ribosome assembly cofactor RimP [Cryomorphaceae bacterium]|nr:ribosome assembly cofactor RimP [Cryomorphaceae bacterium]|tara:strand:- start:1871 stop:2311 length:441 start_codon:yes stop_codon:yes gene_type:complete